VTAAPAAAGDAHPVARGAVWRAGGVDHSLTSELDTISIGEVEEGDLLFCARPGPLQLLSACAKDCFRHVGICVHVDGTPRIIEVSGDYFGSRSLVEAAARYPQMAVARLGLAESCRRGAAAWSAELLDTPNVYAWPDLILAGLIAVTRRRVAVVDPELLERVLRAAAAKAAERDSARAALSLTCSAFVHRAYQESGAACALQVPPTSDARRRGSTGEDTPAATLEELLALGPAHVERLLAEASLYELAIGLHGPSRATRHTRISPGQLADLVVTVVHGVAGARRDGPDVDVGEPGDSRWVTPGDLWRSASVAHRFRLACMPSVRPGPAAGAH
jgi:hypothetical protein